MKLESFLAYANDFSQLRQVPKVAWIPSALSPLPFIAFAQWPRAIPEVAKQDAPIVRGPVVLARDCVQLGAMYDELQILFECC
jgi:hypothetical protein